MRPDQARHKLTQAAPGSGEPSLAGFAPQTAPQHDLRWPAQRPGGDRAEHDFVLAPDWRAEHQPPAAGPGSR